MGKDKRRRKLISAKKAFHRGLVLGNINCAMIAASCAATVTAVQAKKMMPFNPGGAIAEINSATENLIEVNTKSIVDTEIVKNG